MPSTSYKAANPNVRIGQGYDLHQLGDKGPLILGGTEIPFSKNLLGHSDADVVIHAIIDSLLGAANLGDIGKLFPDTDEKYHKASSINLLFQAWSKIQNEGYSLGNIDLTIICQKPKLAPYINQMKSTISKPLSCPEDLISIKAKTNEKQDSTGLGKAISCFSVCLLFRETNK